MRVAAIEKQARIDLLEAKNEIEKVQKAMLEIENIRQIEAEAYREKLEVVELELANKTADFNRLRGEDSSSRRKLKRKMRKASRLYNEARKAIIAQAKDYEVKLKAHDQKHHELHESIALKDAELMGYQIIFETEGKKEELIDRLRKENDTFKVTIESQKRDLKHLSKANIRQSRDVARLNRKVYKINKRRKYTSKLYMASMKEAAVVIQGLRESR